MQEGQNRGVVLAWSCASPVATDAGPKRAPLDYFRMFYADTAVNGIAKAFDCGLSFFGTDRCVFASDAPFDPLGGAHLIRQSMALVDNLEREARTKVYEGNARRLIPCLQKL